MFACIGGTGWFGFIIRLSNGLNLSSELLVGFGYGDTFVYFPLDGGQCCHRWDRILVLVDCNL